jgi:hypothetical protein
MRYTLCAIHYLLYTVYYVYCVLYSLDSTSCQVLNPYYPIPLYTMYYLLYNMYFALLYTLPHYP